MINHYVIWAYKLNVLNLLRLDKIYAYVCGISLLFIHFLFRQKVCNIRTRTFTYSFEIKIIKTDRFGNLDRPVDENVRLKTTARSLKDILYRVFCFFSLSLDTDIEMIEKIE